MNREPTRNCVYQPYGSISHKHMGDRLYGVAGPKLAFSKIVGLTKAEAEAVCAALDALEDTRATAPTDAALRRAVEAARHLRRGLEESVSDDDGECTACGAELFDDETAEFLGLGAHYQSCPIRAFCEAVDAADPAPAETGDDGEND